jgi:hypothetical protein
MLLDRIFMKILHKFQEFEDFIAWNKNSKGLVTVRKYYGLSWKKKVVWSQMEKAFFHRVNSAWNLYIKGPPILRLTKGMYNAREGIKYKSYNALSLTAISSN